MGTPIEPDTAQPTKGSSNKHHGEARKREIREGKKGVWGRKKAKAKSE
jgi:hypothetical protein